jgi:hypothetical protein
MWRDRIDNPEETLDFFMGEYIRDIFTLSGLMDFRRDKCIISQVLQIQRKLAQVTVVV